MCGQADGHLGECAYLPVLEEYYAAIEQLWLEAGVSDTTTILLGRLPLRTGRRRLR